MKKYWSITVLITLALSLIFSTALSAATHYSNQYLSDLQYVFKQLSESNDDIDLSDERQYRHLVETLQSSECMQSTQVMRDLNLLRANHKRFGGPGQVVSKNDDNPDGIIEPYNETTALYPLNEAKTRWGATALSSIPGGTEYSCVVLQIFYIGPGINLPVGEGESQDLSCGVDLQLKAETYALTAEQVKGLNSGDFRLVPRLTYVYKEINGAAKTGYGSLPPVTSNVPKIITVDEPTQKANNAGNDYIKVCISRTQFDDCDYEYTNGAKELILPLKGQITYNQTIADPTAASSIGLASILAVNTTTGGNCVEPNDIGSTFFTDPNTSWDDGAGTVLTWDIPNAQLGKIASCAVSGAKMDFVQVLTLQLKSTNGILYPVTTSITSQFDQYAGPSVFKMPYLSTYSGCLAEDTEITLADGKESLLISSEDLFSSDNPVATSGSPGGKLWVQGNSIGMELRMSYQVTDNRGNKIIMTAYHPIFAKNLGDVKKWIFAKNLTIGAELSTLDGPSTVTTIEQVNYEERVFNLFVSNEDSSPVPTEQMNFYANKILVGDGNMQTLMKQEESGLSCSQ
jgi:hypothetical protein